MQQVAQTQYKLKDHDAHQFSKEEPVVSSTDADVYHVHSSQEPGSILQQLLALKEAPCEAVYT